MNFRRSFAILGATAALLAIGSQPMLAIGGLRSAPAAVQPTVVSPAAAGAFGANLNTSGELSNGYAGQACPSTGACTRVMVRAYNNGSPTAPHDGWVDRIKLIGGVPGSLRLFFVKLDPVTHKAKAVKKGPVITYKGNPDNDAPMIIETFDIPDIHVRKGWRLAVKSSTTSILRCDSANGSYTYQPGLVVGAGYQSMTDESSCALMIKAVYR